MRDARSYTMVTAPTRLGLRSVHNIALAYFDVPSSQNDAIRDLCSAGFKPDHINISRSPSVGDGSDKPIVEAIGSHSRRWQWNRSYAHDLNRRGTDQMSGRNPTPSLGPTPTCSPLDLITSLTVLGVSTQIIWLLTQDVLRGATYLMVDAHDRVAEAGEIMSRNAGHVRTDYL